MQKITSRNIKTWSKLGQRGTVCGVALPELALERDNIYVLTADLAQLSGLDRFRRNNPDRFINVGIAEQNMIGVAAGISFENNCVFATTYATFISMRCYEQVRHNLGYHQANVKLIGSSSGLAMGMSGNTHYTIEDIAIMRVIPNVTVLSPADATEAYLMTYAIADYNGPVYMRLSGNLNNECIYEEGQEYQVGKAQTLREGADVALIGTGSMVLETIRASQALNEKGITAKVINMSTIKPLDKEVLQETFGVRLIVTCEEHSIVGGLGGAVAEYLSNFSIHPKQIKIGINDSFIKPSDYGYLKAKYGLTAEHIIQVVEENLGQ